MFRNRSFNVKMVRDDEPKKWEDVLAKSGAGVTFTMSPEQLSNAATEFIDKNTTTIVEGIAAVIITKTVCDVVRMAAKAFFR